MLDFNTKKAVLRRLRAKRNKNKALWLPCVIAELCVKLWYTLLTGLELALSGKNGKLFGVISTEKKEKTRRQDDIVYVKRPFLGRLLSAVLAASLMLMFMPEIFPEMDIAIRASAAYGSGPTVDFPGESGVAMYRDIGRSTDNIQYLFRVTDFDKANGGSAEITGFMVGYKAVNATWQLTNSTRTEITSTDNRVTVAGYNVEMLDSTNTLLGQKYFSVTNTNPVTWTFKDGEDGFKIKGDNPVYLRVTPVFNIWEYQFIGELGSITPGSGAGDINLTVGAYKVTYEQEGNTIDNSAAAVLPCAHFEAADMTISVVDSTNMDVEYCTSDDRTISLRWDAPYQVGGTGAGDAPMGYNIYQYDATTSTITGRKIGIAASFTNRTIADDFNLIPGHHYRFFIEAYKNIWGGSSANNGYAPTNAGMASSSLDNANKADTEKYQFYSNNNAIADLYVAPAIECETPVYNANSITVKWKKTHPSGIYAGVEIYRSIDTPVTAAPGSTLTDTLVGSGLMIKDYVNSGQVEHKDTTVRKGAQYYYYVVPFIQKQGVRMRGEAAQVSAGLEYSMTRVNITPAPKDGEVKISWTASSNQYGKADGYKLEIYPKKLYNPSLANGKGDVEDVDSTTASIPVYTKDDFGPNDLSFNHTGLFNREVYRYVVTPYVNVRKLDDTIPFYGDPSEVTVTVGSNLASPENVTADCTADGQVTVKWNAVTGATGYTVNFEDRDANGNLWEKGTFDSKGTSKVHKERLLNHTIVYTVTAYKNVTVNNVTQTTFSDPSEPAKVIVGSGLGIPQDFKYTTTDGTVSLTWSAVPTAEYYTVHFSYKPESGGYWTSEEQIIVNKPAFTHTGLHNGDEYKYYITAHKTVSNSPVVSPKSVELSIVVGITLDPPKDFDAVTTDGVVNLSWTASKGAEGYVIYARSSSGKQLEFDVSKLKYSHIGLENGETWTYYAVAYKTVNGKRTFSKPTNSRTIQVGVSLSAAMDLTATAGSRQIDLSWTAVKGAEGYVVYLYNSSTMEFEPITAVSGTKYSHIGLKNGKKYTYMVAPFKTINGERFYGDYSMAVSAIPTTGSITDIDHELNVRGTTPYGISHSEYISANANHGAFDESVDVYFTTNRESTNEVKDVLKHYANGLKSFIIYPFDISVYQENTRFHVAPNDGYTVTITMPIPDRLIAYRDYLTVVHIGEATTTETEANKEILDPSTGLVEDWIKTPDSRLQVLPCAVLDIDNVWCIQFVCTEFSPYAFVIYKDHITDVASGGGVINGSFAGTFNSGVLLFTAIPDILPHNKKLKVVAKKKRYRIIKKG